MENGFEMRADHSAKNNPRSLERRREPLRLWRREHGSANWLVSNITD